MMKANLQLPIFFTLIFLNLNVCVSQPKEPKWNDIILENFYPITSFDSDNNKLFGSKNMDFPKNTRIIQLGENTHGDGTTFKLKTKFIKYLHEEKGFDVFVFESGWFELLDVQKKLIEKQGALKAIENNIYDIYMCQEVLDLFTYIQSTYDTDRPIKVYGLDPQMSSHSSAERQYREISYLSKLVFPNKDLSNDLRVVYEVTQYLQSVGIMKITNETYNSFLAFTDLLLKNISKLNIKKREIIKWRNTIENLRQMTELLLTRELMPTLNAQNFNEIINSPIYIEANNYRDRQMANNVLTITNQLEKDEKIIIWAANYHIFTEANRKGSEVNKVTMGMKLKEELGDNLITISSLAYSGTWQIINSPNQQGTYNEDNEETVFHFLNSIKAKYGVLNLDKIKKNKKIEELHKLNLTDKLEFKDISSKSDYILFVQTMEPTSPIVNR